MWHVTTGLGSGLRNSASLRNIHKALKSRVAYDAQNEFRKLPVILVGRRQFDPELPAFLPISRRTADPHTGRLRAPFSLLPSSAQLNSLGHFAAVPVSAAQSINDHSRSCAPWSCFSHPFLINLLSSYRLGAHSSGDNCPTSGSFLKGANR